MLKAIFASLCLMTCAACTTVEKPAVIVQTEILKPRLPAALAKPCDPVWRKAGGPATTEDFVVRGDHNETGLVRCSAKVDKIIAWDKAN